MILLIALLLTVGAFAQEEPQGLLREAQSQLQQRHFREASEAYRRALQGQPRPFEALLGLAKSQIGVGRPQDAVPLMREALSLKPTDREARRTLAEALAALRQFSQAQAMLEDLTNSDDNDNESWFDLGSLLYQNGYFNVALAALDKSRRDAGADHVRVVKTEIFRAVCLARIGRTGEAQALFEKLSHEPEARGDPDLLLVYAELLFETGNTKAALDRVDEALAENPSDVMAFVWRARLLFHMKQLPEAATAAEHAVDMIPQLPFARALLVRIYEAEGREGDAAKEADWLREYEDRQNRGIR